MGSIQLKSVGMRYTLEVSGTHSVKEYLIRLARRQLEFRQFDALTDVSFCVNRGETFGILGKNGSGKSTLLKLIAGVLKPTKGEVLVEGSIAPLLELGAGFDGELTGRENIFLNGALLGYSRVQMKSKYEEILMFADIGEFINVSVKNYSSGMFARLAFAIAMSVRPDILLVDEVLAVGDIAFQEKCFGKIQELKQAGTTIVMVSHSLEDIGSLCDRALWLDVGEIRKIGNSSEVVEGYRLESLGLTTG